MKLCRHALVTHITKCSFHFWLLPSIEVDYEHFKAVAHGEHKWLHIYFAWLFWAIDLEWED